MVRNSVKPWPTLPSAKYHVGLIGPIPVGVGVGVGVGGVVGVAVGGVVGVAVGVLVGVFVGVANVTKPLACVLLCGLSRVQARTMLPTIANSARPVRTIIPTLTLDNRDIPQKLFVFIV